MVLTRSQISKSNPTETIEIDYKSDNDSEASFPDCNARGASNNIDRANLLDLEGDHETIRNDQRFIEMNNQIRESTTIVKSLANQITSVNSSNERNTPQNREENTQTAVNLDTLCHSDMVTGATATQQTNPNRPPPTRYPQLSIHDIDDIVTEIHHLRQSTSDNVTQPKILQTQVPLFSGNREKYYEFEHLLLNHLRHHKHRLKDRGTEVDILTEPVAR